MSEILSPEAREALRALAWGTIRARLAGDEFDADLPAGGPLSDPGSAFVTLEKSGRLRGCVGMIGEKTSVAEAVRRAALSVTRDPRFPPLAADELPRITLEISVLSPFRDVSGPEEVDVSRHGVYVMEESLSALLLPRVARDRGWDRDRLLTEVCLKAGLAGDRWRNPGLILRVFTAEEF